MAKLFRFGSYSWTALEVTVLVVLLLLFVSTTTATAQTLRGSGISISALSQNEFMRETDGVEGQLKLLKGSSAGGGKKKKKKQQQQQQRETVIHLEAEDYDRNSVPFRTTISRVPDGIIGGANNNNNNNNKALVQVMDGDWIGFRNINFDPLDGGFPFSQFSARVHSASGGRIEVRLDQPDGTMIGKLLVLHTNGSWTTESAELAQHIHGVHDLYFVFKAELDDDSKYDMFRLNWIELSTKPWTTVGNPIIYENNVRTADPAAHVWTDYDGGETIWVYTSHDPQNATRYETMDSYRAFSSTDMKTWTDHGEILHWRDVSWGVPGWMWAPDVCSRNGKYYLYFPHIVTIEGDQVWRIGVAVSDVPQGPFKDIGHYMEGTSGTDPACFQDDGDYYLYFGNKQMAKLADNMVELAEESRKVDVEYGGNMEGAWMHKRNGVYYYSFTTLSNVQPWYSNNNIDEKYQAIYSMGPTPYGPFEKMYPLNQVPPGAQDHHAIVEFKGHNYYFYHKGGAGTHPSVRRNVCVDQLEYREDGSIVPITMTREGVSPLDSKR